METSQGGATFITGAGEQNNGKPTFKKKKDNKMIIRKILEEGEKIKCKKCGWSWDKEDGGKDMYVCHKCGYDNTPLREDDTQSSTLVSSLLKSFSELKIITKLKGSKQIDDSTADCEIELYGNSQSFQIKEKKVYWINFTSTVYLGLVGSSELKTNITKFLEKDDIKMNLVSNLKNKSTAETDQIKESIKPIIRQIISEGFRNFNSTVTKKTPKQIVSRCMSEIKKKLNETKKLMEYTKKIKESILSEGDDLSYAERPMNEVKKMMSETFKSFKSLSEDWSNFKGVDLGKSFEKMKALNTKPDSKVCGKCQILGDDGPCDECHRDGKNTTNKIEKNK